MATGRRGFLRGLAALAGGLPFGARLLGAQGQSPQEPWDTTWRNRITGQFRAVFDSPDIAGAAELWRAAMWKTQIAEVYGAAPDRINAVLVVRHRAMPMIMNDDFWKRHELGKKVNVNDPTTSAPAERNPFRAAQTDGPAARRGTTIESFLSGGGIILACNIAFARMVSYERQADSSASREDARARALAQVIPGVVLQPSGFFAALEAQRVGCGFFPSTGAAE
jgi:hypothetical protein